MVSSWPLHRIDNWETILELFNCANIKRFYDNINRKTFQLLYQIVANVIYVCLGMLPLSTESHRFSFICVLGEAGCGMLLTCSTCSMTKNSLKGKYEFMVTSYFRTFNKLCLKMFNFILRSFFADEFVKFCFSSQNFIRNNTLACVQRDIHVYYV